MAKTASYMRAYRARKKAAAAQAKGPASVDESLQRIRDLGLKVSYTTETNTAAMGEQFAQDVADVLTELESRYGAIGGSESEVSFVVRELGPGTYAAVAYSGLTFKNKELRVSTRMSYDKHNESVLKDKENNWTSPFDTNKWSGVQATIAHEYGHMLHNALAIKHNVQTKRQRTAFLNNQRKAIQKIATEKYGAKPSDVSRYATTNAAEFFAEAFANATGGAPNPIGLAFNDYMAGISDWRIPGQKIYNR